MNEIDERDERDARLVYWVYLVGLVCLVDPRVRASDEHCFIVRVLRARRMVWRFPSPRTFRPHS